MIQAIRPARSLLSLRPAEKPEVISFTPRRRPGSIACNTFEFTRSQPMSRSVTPRLRLETLEDRTTPSLAYALTDNNVLFRFDTTKPVNVQSAIAVTGLASGDSLV